MERFVYDYSKLKGKISEKGFTIESLAKRIGITSRTVYAHLNEQTCFSMDQAILIGKALELESIDPYFCAVKVSKF